MRDLRVAVLVSGRGSNLRALHARSRAAPFAISGVLCNRPEAPALAWARAQGLRTHLVDHRCHRDRSTFDAALDRELEAVAPDLVVLAGFMRVLTDAFVHRWSGRLVNVHPSLLPAYPGLHTHARALADGVRVHGATVHRVVPTVDGGQPLATVRVPVWPGDDAASLGARVLAQEHRLLPAVVEAIARRRLTLDPPAWDGVPLPPSGLRFEAGALVP